ncbi:MAG: helix-turn-helix transcriptional regulator [Ruminococcaceae bacterium]|nr:helix-turn-helix transcriptional regulator [Oscillospiraceae bacterium]
MVNTSKIKELMAKKNLTQQTLADAVGVTEAAISYILRGLRDPSYRIMINISKVLECTIDELTIK